MAKILLDSLNNLKSPKYQRFLSVLLSNMKQGIIFTDHNSEIMFVNKKFTEITGYTLDEVKGKTPRILQSGIQDRKFYDEMKESIQKYGRWKGRLWNRTKQGEIYLQELLIFAIKNEKDEVENLIGFITRLSGNNPKIYEERLDYIYYDPLTTLPNRILFEKRLFSTIQLLRKRRGRNRNFAIVFLKFTDFAAINEQYGTIFGNILLKKIAERLTNSCNVQSMVTRWDGTQFACILEGFKDRAEVEEQIQKMQSILANPYIINNVDVNVDVYFGVYIYQKNGTSVSTILTKASKALETAIELQQPYSFYEESMGLTNHFLVTESEIMEAINKEQFVLYYQPVLSISGELIGFEALIRWEHPVAGVISPDRFIPLAERTGLIKDIGEFVLKTACAQQVEWKRTGIGHYKISINISVNQFKDEKLVEKIKRTIEETCVDPEDLMLELTESSIIENVEDAVIKLKQLRDLGITISVDDFGTGYSSLGYLIDLPINIIKIDRSFVKKLEENRKSAAIVQAISNMAKALDIQVVAEGIETERQFEIVKKLQCDMVQGFYFDRPLAPEQVEEKWMQLY